MTPALTALAGVGARPVVVASLMTLGQVGRRRITEHGLAVETLETLDHRIWPAAECPLCAENVPLEN